jgi:hypothetical protein
MLVNTKLFNFHDIAMIGLVAIIAVSLASRVTAAWTARAADDVNAQG